jgi:hypothetical protein
MLSDAIPLTEIKRVLVIKLRHHGDVLLTSPVFQVLKNHAPHLEVDALVYHDTREMLTEHPAIEEVFTIDREWKHGPGDASFARDGFVSRVKAAALRSGFAFDRASARRVADASPEPALRGGAARDGH